MGWTFTKEKDLNRFITSNIEDSKTIVYSIVQAAGQTIAWELRQGKNMVYIVCNLMERDADGWGVKRLCEEEHPYYYSCPIEYLDKAPVGCQEWRDIVMKHDRTPINA